MCGIDLYSHVGKEKFDHPPPRLLYFTVDDMYSDGVVDMNTGEFVGDKDSVNYPPPKYLVGGLYSTDL